MCREAGQGSLFAVGDSVLVDCGAAKLSPPKSCAANRWPLFDFDAFVSHAQAQAAGVSELVRTQDSGLRTQDSGEL